MIPFSLNSKVMALSHFNVLANVCPLLVKESGSFRPGSFRPNLGVGRFGLGRWVGSALGRFGPVSFRPKIDN